MGTKNSRDLTLDDLRKAYQEIEERQLPNGYIESGEEPKFIHNTVKVKGEDIPVVNIMAGIAHITMSGEETASFDCCRPGCSDYPCQ